MRIAFKADILISMVTNTISLATGRRETVDNILVFPILN